MDEKALKERLASFEREYELLCSQPDAFKETIENVLNILLDDLTLEVIFEAHRKAKLGTGLEEEKEQEYTVYENSMEDSNKENSSNMQCICPVCKRTIVAIKFAPHLEICMGIGRRMNRNVTKTINTDPGLSCSNTDENNAAINLAVQSKELENNNINMKKEKIISKKSKNNPTVSKFASLSYDTMSAQTKKNLLSKYCGVITKKKKIICSKTLRCHAHSEESRIAIRKAVIEVGEDEANANHVDSEFDNNMNIN